ncbi:MAG TPA: fibrillarin-like rRNA/tRNA 2'-O-methyltransferase, partial [Thermoplasmatales archaeon]|nr:fibrillarin-like rRNA/tRNA 2'-O-methyltransferase [Thermoplasmatales archaeon]
ASHLSDIVQEGLIYAVEISPLSMQKLVELCKDRDNIIPILSDASHPWNYSAIVPKVDVIYQDISQRDQVEIFVENCNRYLKKGGEAIIMVKARSIDVTAEPRDIYEKVKTDLSMRGYKIKDWTTLKPYSKDHAVMVVKKEC